MDILCASQAATTICASMEPSGSSSPAIDRYNPIIRDSRRCNPLPPPPPIPKPHRNRHKKKKENIDEKKIISRKSWSCTKPGEFISPPGSTRYLLSGKELLTALEPPLTSKDENSDESSCDAKPPSSSPDQVNFLNNCSRR